MSIHQRNADSVERGLNQLPPASTSSSSNPAHTPTSSSVSGGPPPHPHLPPNFRPFLTPPGGGGGGAPNGGSPHHPHHPHHHTPTPPFPMWPLPGLFPGAHSLFGGGGGSGPRDGRSLSPGMKEAARGRLSSGHQDKELTGMPALMPREALDEKQVNKKTAFKSSSTLLFPKFFVVSRGRG